MKLKILFFPLTLILSLTIMIWFIKPAWDKFKMKEAELDKISAEYSEMEKGMKVLDNALNDYEFMGENDRVLINNALPKNKNNDDLVAEIHLNAVDSNVILSEIKTKEARNPNKQTTTGEVPGYVAPELERTLMDLSVVSSYLNVKRLVEEIDFENRFSIPKKLEIQELDDNSTEVGEEDQPSNETILVKATISFLVLDKEENNKIKLSMAKGTNDPVAQGLFSSGLKNDVIKKFKETITSEHFKPVTAQGAGKQDLFAK